MLPAPLALTTVTSMSNIYCPYTDRYLPKEKSSSEHIIPLALGGANGFELPVDAEFNKSVGSQIDGKLSNDFFMTLRRIRAGARGHSGKEPSYVSKKVQTSAGEPLLRLRLTRSSGIQLWGRGEPPGVDSLSQVTFSEQTAMRDFRIRRIRFVAKVALSSGYFIFGDSFRTAVQHSDLRTIMNFSGDFEDPTIKSLAAGVDVQLGDNKHPILQAFRYVTRIVGGASCVGLVPLSDRIAFFVGLLGEYIGTIEVPCTKAELPHEPIHSLGTFVCIQESRPIISSWERLITRVGDHLRAAQTATKSTTTESPPTEKPSDGQSAT